MEGKMKAGRVALKLSLACRDREVPGQQRFSFREMQ